MNSKSQGRKALSMTETATKILVVDDESTITDFVSYALKKEGYDADVVQSGEDALTLAAQNDYDLFILDIMLPGMDGYELCRRIRTNSATPVLFLSARGYRARQGRWA